MKTLFYKIGLNIVAVAISLIHIKNVFLSSIIYKDGEFLLAIKLKDIFQTYIPKKLLAYFIQLYS